MIVNNAIAVALIAAPIVAGLRGARRAHRDEFPTVTQHERFLAALAPERD